MQTAVVFFFQVLKFESEGRGVWTCWECFEQLYSLPIALLIDVFRPWNVTDWKVQNKRSKSSQKKIMNYGCANYFFDPVRLEYQANIEAVWKIVLQDTYLQPTCFRPVKTAEEERKMLEQSVPKYIRSNVTLNICVTCVTWLYMHCRWKIKQSGCVENCENLFFYLTFHPQLDGCWENDGQTECSTVWTPFNTFQEQRKCCMDVEGKFKPI